MLLGSVAALAAVSTSKAFAAEHDMHDMAGMHEHHHEASTRNSALISAASDCVLKAQVCLQHCLVLLGEGDKSLAACAKSSSQVEAICGALQNLAAAESKSLPALAKVAMDICKDCEEECKKTDKHPQCKACGEACAACYKECKKIAV
jgi:Cys-rich four helix bundle protein (predicted Tat secretion target)